jgi:hypothetical protein
MPETQRLRLALIGVTIAYYVIAITAAQATGLTVLYSEWFWLGFYCLLGFAPFCTYAAWKGFARFRALGETMLCGLLLTAPVVGLTYAAMHAGFPLADRELMAIDAALGFDWQRFILFVDAHPWLERALSWSYQSFTFQILLLPPALCLAGHMARAYALVIGYALICLVSSFISVWYPALGTYTVHGADQLALKNIDTYFGYFFLEQFNAVRSDPDFVLTLKKIAGILTFPSVHAANGVLYAWAAWSFRYARYPMLILNGLMITAAVSHSNHYVVDVIAGIGVAAACVAIVSLYARTTPLKRAASADAIPTSPSGVTA